MSFATLDLRAVPKLDDDIEDWARRISAYLEYVPAAPYTVEEVLALGGEMAARSFGFEGTVDSAAAPGTDIEILTGPVGVKKKIVYSLAAAVADLPSGGSIVNYRLYKKKNSIDYPIVAGKLDRDSNQSGVLKHVITLDNPDEALWFNVEHSAPGPFELTWDGSYLDVD